MLYDFHCHILPGIDDGSPNLQTSRKMLEMEKKDGVGKIVLTPHFYLDQKSLARFLDDRAGAIEQLQPVADELGIELKFGAEVRYTKSLLDQELDKLCISGTNYMLIEMPFERLTDRFINEFKTFAGSIFPDIQLILAHAERYLLFTSEESVYRIMENDMLVQLNCGDFGAFSRSRKFMFELLDHDLAHLLGTDCHNTSSRPPNMETARKIISKKISPHCFSHLMRNAEKVFAGEMI